MIPPRQKKERPSTYVVQNRSNQEELRRLQLQDRLITSSLGGILPEHAEPLHFDSVLDVACGTGGWLIDLAKTYPTISQLAGVDISRRMIETAREEAEAQHVQDRVTFHVMDVLDALEWPENSFDLTNLRLAVSFLRTWEWPNVIYQLQRVTRPGGIIRLTEADLPVQSSSPALLRLFDILTQAYDQAGRYFRPQAHGVSDDLAHLLEQQGIQNVQIRACHPEVKAGTTQGELFFDDMKYLFRTNVPFIMKWNKMPKDYENLYKRMLREMQHPDFFAVNQTITAWGYKTLTTPTSDL